MNIVKITNRIALATVILLMYWVFIFICSTVFGFKVFRENMTEMFFMSIVGIFAILGGAIILNIMFNLTAIAEGRKTGENNTETKQSAKNTKRFFMLFPVSLAVIFGLLYAGDLTTSRKNEQYLVSSAADLLQEQNQIIDRLSDYTFSREYIEQASEDIRILGRVEEKFPQITVITRDQLMGKPVLLGFTGHANLGKDEKALKADYILSTSSEERKYLNAVFDGNTGEHRFSSSDGRHEVYYPVTTEKGQVVIHLTRYSRYGKMGS
ncbi:hypothetical protein ACWJJH_02290 [Endozoicomonadaceae bacterium StTr2]